MSIYDEAIKEAEWHGEIEGSQTVKTIITALKQGKQLDENIDVLFKVVDEFQGSKNLLVKRIKEWLVELKER